MCKGGKKQKASNQTASKAPAAAAAGTAAGAPVGLETGVASKSVTKRRRRRGKRGLRLAGQDKLRLTPTQANVGGSGRTGLNIPRSS